MSLALLRTLLGSALIVIAFVACSDEGDDPTDPGCTEFPCGAWFPEDYLTSGDWAEVSPCITSEHGGTVRVHIYPASAAAFYLDRAGRVAGFDEGTILVKTETLTSTCGDPVRFATVMRKGPTGTAPGTGDWEWQQVDYITKNVRSGQLPDCLSAACHTSSGCGPDYDYTCIDPDA